MTVSLVKVTDFAEILGYIFSCKNTKGAISIHFSTQLKDDYSNWREQKTKEYSDSCH